MAGSDQAQPHCATCGQNSVTEYRLGQIDDTLKQLVDTFSHFALLEERHRATNQSVERAFLEIGKQDDRITEVEVEMPTLKLARTWVLALMGGSFTTLVSILAVLVFGSPL